MNMPHYLRRTFTATLAAIAILFITIALMDAFYTQPKQHWYKCDWQSFSGSSQCKVAPIRQQPPRRRTPCVSP